MSEGVCDITVIGAGPVGLAAAYYAGHRDASVRIVESLGATEGAPASGAAEPLSTTSVATFG